VLDRFKAGEGNVLVATSIGEEGLDIGEIDMVICYDAQKTPIRMVSHSSLCGRRFSGYSHAPQLQRIGRTGRKSDGYVHILMAEGREEDNWNKSKEAYEAVQRAIVRAEQLELYADVPRLLPDTAKPQCIEMVMEIEEYSRQTSRNQSAVDEGAGGNDDSPQKKSTKRKRNDDVARNAPDGVAKGFQSVKEMLSGGAGAGKGKGKGKGRAKKLKPSNLDDTTDDDDREIEAGIFAPSTKKTNVADIPVSADAGAGTSSAKKRRTKKDTDDSIAGPTSKAKANKVAAPKPKKSVKRKGVIIDPPTLSQAGKTDSEDEAILNGLDPFFSAKNVRDKGKGKSPAKSPQKRGGYIEVDNGLSSNEEDLNSPPSGRKDTSKSKSASRTSRTFSPQPVFLPAEDDDTIDLVSHDRSRSASLAPVNRSRSHTRSPSPFDWDLPPDLDTFTMPPSAERVGIPSTDLHDDEEGALEPLFLPSQAPPGSALAPSRRQSFTPPPHSRSAPSIHETEDVSWLLGSDEDEDRDHSAIEIHSSPPPPSPPPPPLRARLDTPSHEVDKEEEEDVEFADTPSILNSPPSPALSVPIASPAPPPPRHRAFSAQAMPPPALLPPATHLSFESPPQPSFPIGRGVAARKRVLLHDSSPVEQSASFDSPPQPSFPVARGGAARKRVLLPDSSPLEQSVRRAPKGLQRLQRARESSPTSPLAPRPAKRTKRIRPRPDAAALRAFVEDEAGHSGAEVSEGSSGEDDPESESDLRFLRAPPETQIPEGYAQTQVYARSLATQAPGGPGPQFAARPRARGRFGPIRTPVRRARRASSPVTELGSEPDEYSFGSFIVEDEEDIVYEDDSSQLNI
jgi:ATP-dependent DNA helicase MPH1